VRPVTFPIIRRIVAASISSRTASRIRQATGHRLLGIAGREQR
jgi:hypothetical protein